jgi:hypothetical protein
MSVMKRSVPPCFSYSSDGRSTYYNIEFMYKKEKWVSLFFFRKNMISTTLCYLVYTSQAKTK